MSAQVINSSSDGGRKGREGASQPELAAPAAHGRSAIWAARWILGVVLLFNVVAGGAIWAHSANAQSQAAGADLRQRIAQIEQMLGQINLTQPQALAPLQAALGRARADMSVLLNMLPFGGHLVVGAQAAEARLLLYGIAVDDTAQEMIATWQALEPSLIGLRDSVLREGGASNPTNDHLLSLSDVNAAQRTLRLAVGSWNTAVSTRATLSAAAIVSALATLPELTRFAQRLDQLSGTVSAGLAAASSLLDASPGYLGLDGEGYVLLAETNTDVTRPIGGLIQHYALLNFANGELATPIRLEPVEALDCPHRACPTTSLPPTSAWSPLSDAPVQLHDAGLDPELAVTGYVVQRDYTQVNPLHLFGVIVIAPALFANLLRATGPVVVPALRTTFTAQTAQALLSYYHAHSYTSGTVQPTNALDADTLLAQALLAKLATLSATQQAALGQQLIQAIATKDLQFYSTDERIEASLAQLNVAGSVAVPAGDSLYIVDTNVTGLPISPFVHESAADTVTLDALGGATHSLRIVYRYDAHPQGLPATGTSARYTDVVRVVLPNLAASEAITSGCVPTAAIQAFHSVLACTLSLLPGGHATITMTWHVPNVYALPTSVSSAPQDYTLLIQRQPGSEIALSVVVTPPQQYPFTAAAPPADLVNGALQWAQSLLLADTALRVSFARATFAP